MQTQYDITLRQWLRNRPASSGVFEALSGQIFWSHLDDTLEDFCRALGLEITEVQHRLSAVVPAFGHEDWQAKPLERLIDHLTENHKVFRGADLPRIEHLLCAVKLDMGLASVSADQALSEFRMFRQEFIWHMDEEEAFLFPKILRTEACLRHPELYPEVFKGSVRMFPPSQMHLPEEAFREMTASLTEKVRNLQLGRTHAIGLKDALAELLAFGSRLKAHTYLETEILFARAAEMEEELLRRAAQSQT